jgi:hypothetical protein
MEKKSERKEVIKMKAYQKPEIVFSGAAQQVIQALEKASMADDAQSPNHPPATTTAYEADE